MANRMEVLLAALDRQGFESRQSLQGSWFFSRNGTMITIGHEPDGTGEWIDLISALRGAGLVFPDEG
ncbi:hypothetical protein AQJ30_23720 [Streptomyces longwoodensis]|uniref:HicA protein n=2 Tax=Streptomyces longwoodensis TaxID=68231 RepID=A0A101QTY6_9ACTN|nr:MULTISPECIES: hypothetical protein [Streptomyces]KUN35706.1 hypothetical protein AQJ30_23720 [Streptomyces longwoodensis]